MLIKGHLSVLGILSIGEDMVLGDVVVEALQEDISLWADLLRGSEASYSASPSCL